ncbi:MAG: GNAT family N-acetyltransferase [Bdellovibrionales bacterium]|nr:GNAT family N-acetyltransferase [Bdellovibrionales bacterium]
MIFKELQPSDAKEFLQFKKQIALETQNTLIYPEAPFLNEEAELKRIHEQQSNNSIYNLCAFEDNKVIGYLNFRIPIANHPWVKHVGTFGMMVLKEYWRKGIGTQLLQAMEKRAHELNITRIEATVRQDNQRALNLYLKHGYKIEGTKASAAFINDAYQDEIMIAKVLNQETWKPDVIETKRLTLRPLELSDALAIYQYTQKPEVSKYTTWQPHKSIKDTEAFILNFVFPNYQKQKIAPLGVTIKTDPKTVIGTVDCGWVSKHNKVMELAYALDSQYWGQGYTTEACRGLIDYCFHNTNVARIQARCHSDHKASRRVMEKVGMKYEGTLKSAIEKNHQRWDLDLMALTR